MKKTLAALALFCLAALGQAQQPAYAQPMSNFAIPLNGGPPLSGGSVTSVDCAGVTGILNCTGGPVTTTGVFALSLPTQVKNLAFVGPASGANAAPTFRLLQPLDFGSAGAGDNGKCLTQSTSSVWAFATCGGGSGYATIQEEGSGLTQRATFNFIGAAITAADNAGSTRTDVTLSQSPASASVVGTGRTITATSPLTIAGGASADLTADRTIACPTCHQTLNRTTTNFTFSNSSAEQTIYSFSVPGGTLGTLGMLRLTLDNVFLNNSGAARTIRLRVKYGATTLFDDTTTGINPSATTNIVAPMVIELKADAAATGTQRMRGMMSVGDGNTGAPAVGYGNIGAAPSFTFRPFGGTSSEDSTAAKTLAVTVTFDAATATQTWNTRSAHLELIP